MRIVIAGASGLIGRALTAHLTDGGHQVIRLVRREPAGPDERPWSPGQPLAPDTLAGVDAVVNLAGASIAKLPWTRATRAEILNSRLRATHTLTQAIRREPGAALINASAVGFYGSRGDEPLGEDAGPGEGFLAEVTQRWEGAAIEVSDVARVSLVRTGLVIANGGALAPLRALGQLCLAGPLGDGQQWWPWISLTDEVRAIEFLITHDLSGPVNLAGPTPARMVEVGAELTRGLGRPFWLRAPAAALTALLGDAARELLLASQRLRPHRLESAGFGFVDRTVAEAIARVI